MTIKTVASFFDVKERTNALSETKKTFIPKTNIADTLSDEMLKTIGRVVCEGERVDFKSMSCWVENVDRGLKLVKPALHTKNEPWDGASNFKSPTITRAALKFGDRASSELLRRWELVSSRIIGNDEDGEKADKAERTDMFMNYQLNVDMPEWRDEHEKMLYELPYIGTVFKKTFFDSTEGRNRSDLITYPNFVVNQDAKSLDRLRRFSELADFSAREVEEKIKFGLWLDIDLTKMTQDEDSDVEEQTDEDNFHTFIIQNGFFDIDEDGYEEPYTFVVHKGTEKVVRIFPDFEPEDVVVIDQENARGTTLDNLLGPNGIIDGDGGREIARIKSRSNIVKYGFIKDIEGGFLDVGFFNLLGSITEAINAHTNMLTDAGVLSNVQGGFVSNVFRQKMGVVKFKPGQWKSTNLTPSELKDGLLPLPVKEPSNVLLALLQELKGEALELSSAADIASAIGANAPAATTLALISDQQEGSGAIVGRVYNSMSREFRQLYRLDEKFTDPEEYKDVVDDEGADFESDFNIKTLDIVPIANPEISSKVQRIQQAQAESTLIDQVALAGGDIKPILKNFYSLIGSTDVDKIFPEEPPEQQLQSLLQRFPQLQQIISDEEQRQNMIAEAQSQAIMREEERKEAEEERKDAETAASIDKNQKEIEKIESETILNLEKAESEEVKNSIDLYTAKKEVDNGNEGRVAELESQ